MDLALYNKIKNITASDKHTSRIFTQVDYAMQLNKYRQNRYAEEIVSCVKLLCERYNTSGHLRQCDCLDAEGLLMPLSAEAKNQTAICVAHAHLDMNWLWGYDETAAITISTIETMLSLLERYPQFTFSQSQASVYRIIEKLRPDLLEKIKRYVKESRWEITAGAWVECDKNLPSAESLIRQIKSTKEYLGKLFDLPQEFFNFDFQPDTFGHNINVPMILSGAGIKYYYHCRGNDMPPLYRWKSATGGSVLVYREPQWYNAEINEHDFLHVPDFCNRYKLDRILKVYGVGDHGGGATVKDIETILRLASYPIMPNIVFGRYRDFYEYADTKSDLPEITGEQNPIFPGCYASQSLIKSGNAKSEQNIKRAEFFNALSDCGEDKLSTHRDTLLTQAWENVMFNQFHDILPGSGKEATRIHALALYQEADAAAGAVTDMALRAISSSINTSALILSDDDNNVKNADNNWETAIGAGGGYRSGSNIFTNCLSDGTERIFTVFQTAGQARKVCAALDVWDYFGDITKLAAFDENGDELPYRLLSTNSEFYWSHNVHRFEVITPLPAFGYSSILLKPKTEDIPQISYPPMHERTFAADKFVLENAHVRARFDDTLSLCSFYDKRAQKELLSAPAQFRLFREDGAKFMSAWVVGRTSDELIINKNAKLLSFDSNSVNSVLRFQLPFLSSKLTVTVSLAACDENLKFSVDSEFYEKGIWGESIPKLSYAVPLLDSTGEAKYAIPLGIITRTDSDNDVSAQGLAYSGDGQSGLALLSPDRYSYKFCEKTLFINFLRASYDPDPLPEYGLRSFSFGLSAAESDNNGLLNLLIRYKDTPVAVSVKPQIGTREPSDSLLQLKTDAVVSSVKAVKNGLQLRLFNADSQKTVVAELKSEKSDLSAKLTDLIGNGTEQLSINGDKWQISIAPNEVKTIHIQKR